MGTPPTGGLPRSHGALCLRKLGWMVGVVMRVASFRQTSARVLIEKGHQSGHPATAELPVAEVTAGARPHAGHWGWPAACRVVAGRLPERVPVAAV